MPDARRAAPPAYNPRKMLIFVAAAVATSLLLLFLATCMATPDDSSTTAQLPPSPQPTYTSYIPETPQQCRDALDKADDTIEQAHTAMMATFDALERQRLGAPPVAELKDAQKAEDKFTQLTLAYIKLAKKCRTWGGPPAKR